MNELIVVLAIFAFSVSLRVVNLNQMGRTWDEGTYIEWGYKLVELIKKGDFANKYWYENPGFPPVSRYLYGAVAHYDIESFNSKGQPVFKYDATYTRLVSVLFTSLTSVLIVLFGWRYLTPFIGVISGLIFTLLPLSIGYSQIATLESLILFSFTASFYSFLNLLNKFSKKNLLISGLTMGFAFGVKYTNFLLIPMMSLIFIVFVRNFRQSKEIIIKKVKEVLMQFGIALLTFFALWPMPWFHLKEVLSYNYELRVVMNKYPDIEVFFGKLMPVPLPYYFVFFLITTPLLILVLFFIGSKFISDYSYKKIKTKKKHLSVERWILYSLIIWFCFPFVMSFYNFKHHGIRFIIQIIVPLSIISAIGFDYVARKVSDEVKIKALLFFPVFIYLIFVLSKVAPYYLDYYNEVVGGSGNVYKKGLFQVGWWGQGVREAANFLEKNASRGSTVGLAISPIEAFPRSEKVKASAYSDSAKYNYVVVNNYRVLREGFDDSKIRSNYILIYSVKADGAELVQIYKRKP